MKLICVFALSPEVEDSKREECVLRHLNCACVRKRVCACVLRQAGRLGEHTKFPVGGCFGRPSLDFHTPLDHFSFVLIRFELLFQLKRIF